MGKFSLANLFGITIRESANDGSDFTNPDADYRRVFLGEDGELHAKDSAGAVTDLTGAASSDLAGKELDYAEITSNVALTATTEGTAHTVVTGGSVAYDGSTIVEIEFFSPDVRTTNGAAGQAVIILLYEDTTLLGRFGVVITPAAAQMGVPVTSKRRLTPSNASHAYTVKAYVTVSAGAPIIGAGAGGTATALPAFLRITRVSS